MSHGEKASWNMMKNMINLMKRHHVKHDEMLSWKVIMKHDKKLSWIMMKNMINMIKSHHVNMIKSYHKSWWKVIIKHDKKLSWIMIKIIIKYDEISSTFLYSTAGHSFLSHIKLVVVRSTLFFCANYNLSFLLSIPRKRVHKFL